MYVCGRCVRTSVHVHTHGYRYGYTHGGQRTTPSIHLLSLPCLSHALLVVDCLGPWASGDCSDSTFHLARRVLELQPWELPCLALHGFWKVKLRSSMRVASAPAPESPLKFPINFIDFFWHYYKWNCCLDFLSRQYIVSVSSFWVSQIQATINIYI